MPYGRKIIKKEKKRKREEERKNMIKQTTYVKFVSINVNGILSRSDKGKIRSIELSIVNIYFVFNCMILRLILKRGDC